MLHACFRKTFSTGLLALGLVWGGVAQATVTTTTDVGVYSTAVAGISGSALDVIDFEAFSAPTLLPAAPIQGVTLTPSLDTGYTLGVNGVGGVSGLNTLGATNDGGATVGKFVLGESIDFTFAEATHAFGLYVVVGVGFDFFANDVTISFGGNQLHNPVGVVGTSFAFGDYLFMGIVDDVTTFTTANITFGTAGQIGGAALFELDDISFTVAATAPGPGPEPNPGPQGDVPAPPAWLLLTAALPILLRRRG